MHGKTMWEKTEGKGSKGRREVGWEEGEGEKGGREKIIYWANTKSGYENKRVEWN